MTESQKVKVLIIGSGNAGWTAAIYAARAQLEPVVITGYELGGQLTLTTEVENFPGFPDGIMGPELMDRMQKQAEKYGTKVVMDRAESFEKLEDGTFKVKTNGTEFIAESVIIATGASARWLEVEGLDKFKGRGVHTCATCDGAFYKEKEIIVVGGGDSACEEATYLAKIAKKVYLVHRRDELRASKAMQERVLHNPKIEMVWNTEVKKYNGDKNVESVLLYNNKENREYDMPINGVFLALGHIPNTDIFKDLVELDSHGYIVANSEKTNVEGLFAAGDVQDTVYRQAITAAASGCRAAMNAERYLESKE